MNKAKGYKNFTNRLTAFVFIVNSREDAGIYQQMQPGRRGIIQEIILKAGRFILNNNYCCYINSLAKKAGVLL